MKKVFPILLAIVVFSSLLSAQTEMFVRKHILNNYAPDAGGWGNIVTDIDIDNDGKMDLYAVNENSNDTQSELVPRIYKFEWNGTKWDSVWSAEITGEAQNTWPALIAGDWDGDGKKEVIWGPVNNFTAGSTNPARILVFESKGDGSDVMGIPIPGTNNYRPNAKWTITQTASQELRPFRWVLENVDDDAKPELVFGDRQSNYRFGVVSVTTIPDNGDGSEVWTLKASGLGNTKVTGTVYDVNVINKVIYVINSVGRVVPVKWNGSAFAIDSVKIQNLPAGSWKTSCVVDIDNNASKEMVIAGGASGANQKVWLCKQVADTLVYTEIADFATEISSAGRIFGGGFGDIDADGKVDFVFGTRDASPNGAIIRLKYLGGDITNPASYAKQVIDNKIIAAGGRYDIIGFANIDTQAGQEVLYSSGYGDPIPIVTLKRLVVETVAAVRVDANNDLKPDRLNQIATVKAVVNGVNLTASANRFQYTIQDETGGIVITKGSEQGGGTVYNVGDELIASGKITQFRGTVQLELTSLNDVMKVSANNTFNPIPLTIPQYITGGYGYQSRFIEINMLYKDPSVTVPWPPANTDANFGVWDGTNKLILRIDQDTDIDGQPEPVWPIRVKGVATQYTSSATVYNDGYQITPMFYADITPNVPVELTSFIGNVVSGKVVLNWTTATELNNRGFEVQRKTANSEFITVGFVNGAGTTADEKAYSYTDQQIVNEVYTYRLKQLDYDGGFVYSDEINVDVTAPSTFSLEQNYPNPFNPSTSIRFGLPVQSVVDLRIYDVLGNEVAVLINGESLTAGLHVINFNAANLASGTYFYKISTADFSSVKKMQLIK